jgi:hypothetical protein
MVARHRICPKCGSSDLGLIRRSLWMRLISGSEFYLCKRCGQYFLSSELLPGVGFFVVSCGIILLFFTLKADKLGFGHSGVGPHEKVGFVLSAVFTILGLILIYKSKW